MATVEEEKDIAEEEIEEEEEVLLEDLQPQLYRLVYNHPTVILTMLLVLFDVLIERGIITKEEKDAIVKEGLKRWSEFGTE